MGLRSSSRAWSTACVILLLGSVAMAADQDSAATNNAPAFTSTSTEPVLLRYKMKAGQVMKMAIDINSDVRVRVQAVDIKMGQAMRIEAKVSATGVDDKGNISALTRITRMTMKITGPTSVEFDSDKPDEGDANLKAITAMIDVDIPCKISPVGEMLETDLEPLRVAVRRAGNAALSKSLEDSTSKMFEGTFIQLSPNPIGAGEVYKSGTIVASDKIKMHTSYKIQSVAGDRNQAILEPIVVMEMAPNAFPGADAKIRSQEVGGWQLFDVEHGCPGNGMMHANVVIDLTANGEKGTVEMVMKTVVTSSLE